MSKSLRSKLQELQNRGDLVLGAELSALLDATTKASPYSRRLLAHAAQLLREGSPPNFSLAHDYLGAAIEAHLEEKQGRGLELPQAVTASLTEKQATERAFRDVQDCKIEGSPEFETAPKELVRVLAMLLLDGGYTEEARRYLTEYNVVTANQSEERVDEMKTKQALRSLQAKYRKQGDLVRARALEEVIADLDEVQPEDSKASACEKEAQSLDGDLKEKALNAAYMMRAAEELMKDPDSDQAQAAKMMQAADDMMNKVRSESCPAAKDDTCDVEDAPAEGERPVLEVDPPSKEEDEAKDAAQAALASGNIKNARKHLHTATRLEKIRLSAALMRSGDMELAMEGLVEADAGQEEADKPADKPADEVPSEDKSGGYVPKVDPEGEKAPVDEDKEPEGESHEGDEKPIEKPVEDQPKEEDDDVDEKAVAHAIAKTVRIALRKKDMKTVAEGLKDLNSVEKEIVAAVKTAEKEMKDVVLAKEGYKLWKEVRGLQLKTIKIVAEATGDEEEAQKAAKGLDALGEEDLDDTLDSEPKEGEEGSDVATDDAVPEDGEEPAKKEGEEEADAMKYEVLQSVEELKSLKIDRSALAFTFWDHEEDPYWLIQANGKPVAEVHLEDQSEPQDVKAFFCDQSKWPNVIAQSAEKVGLYDMLRGVKARFYAHGVTKTGLAAEVRKEIEASMKDLRAEKLSVLRNDFVDSMAVAAESLNKGLMTGKTNPLKKSFVDKLSALGFHNPALVVEEAFASGFRPWLDQVIADAGEYLEMPKEAFAHTKRMISAATNVAANTAAVFASETLGNRLARTSMPLTHVEESEGAPAEIAASLRQMSAAEKNRDLKNRLRLSNKY